MLSDNRSAVLPIVQYWHSSAIPEEVGEKIAAFREANPEIPHLLFDEAAAEVLIAEHFTQREVAAFRSCAVPTMQSDYFRYCAIHALGGVYADIAFECRRPLRDLIDGLDGGALFRQYAPQRYLLSGLFIFTAPKHPLLQLAVDITTANIENRATQRVNKLTGPWVFTGLAAIHRASSFDAARRLLNSEDSLRIADSAFDAIGNFARVAEAFEDVSIVGLDDSGKWIAMTSSPLAYKTSPTHWTRWQKRESIFRDA